MHWTPPSRLEIMCSTAGCLRDDDSLQWLQDFSLGYIRNATICIAVKYG